MDRFIHTALNAMGNLRGVNSVNAQNLANMNVPGFRRDLTTSGTTKFLTELNSLSGRAFQSDAAGQRFSSAAGFMDQTGEQMDVLMDKGRDLIDSAAELIRERPLAAFGVAFAAGWIIAKLARSGGDK